MEERVQGFQVPTQISFIFSINVKKTFFSKLV